ncbi:YncE family protein [Pseudomonas sp. TWP3-2]|uniref:YncE family protein n=1 Tax=Pseudomonas sp. TWP3-2 TaxID=2804574 RepID=UPI003CFBBB1B
MNIYANSAQATALLVLYPMAIPGAQTNVLPLGLYDLGIPLSIYSLLTDLYMVIDPVGLLSAPMAAGDSVRLWVNGNSTSVVKVIKKGEENERIELEAPWGLLMDGLNKLWYEVTRVSGNTEKSTPILNVLFNSPAPKVSVSHPLSVGPGQTSTFSFTRTYGREYDKVRLTVGTWSRDIPFVHPATQFTYALTAADLVQIGDGTHNVFGIAHDQLANTGLSATTSITVTANQQLIVPTLTNVLDQNNNEVPPNATTPSTTLTLKGKAHQLQQVEIYDGSGPSAVSKGIETVSPAGDWLCTITVPVGPRRLYAKSRYHPTNTYSNVRLLTVEVDVVVAFLNAPYSATAGAQVTGIELVVTEAGKPTAGKIVTVTLPQGSTFPGGSNVGIFTTDANGKVVLAGVTAGSGVGTFSIEAVSEGATANAVLTIVAQTPVGLIRLSDAPYGIKMSPDGTTVCVQCSFSLYLIDVATATVRLNKTLAEQGSHDLAFSPDGTQIYVCASNNAVLVVNAETLLTIGRITVTGTPIGIVLSEKGDQAFVSTWNGHTVAVLDLNKQVVVKTISVGIYPRGIARSRDGTRIYVVNAGLTVPSSVSEIDIPNLAVTKTIPVGFLAYDVAESVDGNSIFVGGSSNTQGMVLQFNAYTWTPIKTIRVTPPIHSIGLNHAGTHLYCVGHTTGSVTTIDIEMGEVTDTTAVEPRPIKIVTTRDDTRGFVTCIENSTVKVIALSP